MMGGLKNKTVILNYTSYTSDKNQPSLFSEDGWALGSLSYCVTQYSCLEPEDFGIYREREREKKLGWISY